MRRLLKTWNIRPIIFLIIGLKSGFEIHAAAALLARVHFVWKTMEAITRATEVIDDGGYTLIED